MLPPLSALGNIKIELVGPSAGSARWDESNWDSGQWATLGWRDVTPQAVRAQLTWGADDPAGVVTVPAAGNWTLTTHDPTRRLDPSNPASEFIGAIRPGAPIRILLSGSGEFLNDDFDRQASNGWGNGWVPDANPEYYSIVNGSGRITRPDGAAGRIMSKPLATPTADIRYTDIVVMPKPTYPMTTDTDVYLDPLFLGADTTGCHLSYEVWNGELYLQCGFRNADNSNVWVGEWVLASPACQAAIVNGLPIKRRFEYDSATREARAKAWPATDAEPFDWDTKGVDTRPTPVPIITTQWIWSWGWNVAVPLAWAIDDIKTSPPDFVVRRGVIDEVEFDLAALTGSLRGTDGVALMVGAQMLEGQNADASMPATLRARARYLISKVGLSHIITVEPDPADPPDPPVAPLLPDAASAWFHITSSAYDALYAVWLDREGVLRFRSFGAPLDRGLQAGGADGIPVVSIKTQSSLQAIYTKVTAYDDGAPTVPVTVSDPKAIEIYGEFLLEREKAVPDAAVWTASVLADRAGASLQYVPGTLYPTTFEQLRSIIDAGMAEILHINAETVDPPITAATRILGGAINADTDVGWTASFITYVPAKEWQEAEPPIEQPPVDPPVDPPPGTHRETRYYDCIKDTRVSLTSAGDKYGAGTQTELPIGAYSGWRNRAFLDFDQINFSDVKTVVNCVLELDTSTQEYVAFGSAPKISVKRVTEGWSEGSASTPSSGNATVYPGPSVSGSNVATQNVPDNENAVINMDITGIGRAWQGGSVQQGVGIFSAGEDATKYTTEIWGRAAGTTSRRPRIKLVVDVWD